jgi:hypothetical protein
MRNGTGSLSVNDSAATLAVGVAFTAGTIYWGYQAFNAWGVSVGSDEVVTSAAIRVKISGAFNTWFDRGLAFKEYDWDTSLDTSDYRSGSWLTSHSDLGVIAEINGAVGYTMEGGNDTLVARVQAGTSPLRTVAVTDQQSGYNVPTAQYDAVFYSADRSGTAEDPALIYTTVSLSTHMGVGGAQVRLATGDWACLTSNGDATPVVNLSRVTSAGDETQIAVVPTGTSSTDFNMSWGFQALSLVVDDLDNIYVIGPRGSALTAVAAKAYVKGAGNTWAAQTTLSGALPQYTGAINGTVGGWHDVGSSGTIMMLCGRSLGDWWGRAPAYDMSYGLLNCASLLAGSGTLLRASGPATGTLVPTSSRAHGWAVYPANECGASLDLQVPPGGGNRGYVVSVSGDHHPGDNAATHAARYVLNSTGTGFTATAFATGCEAWGVKGPESKYRILAISDTQFAIVSADEDTGYGFTVVVVQNSGVSTDFTLLGVVRVCQGLVASLPAEDYIASLSAWDALYDPDDNKVWIYYINVEDEQELYRTSVDLDTYLPVCDEVVVESEIVGAAMTCTSVRVERNARQGDSAVLISCAVDSLGSLSNVYVTDNFNQAPTTPVLVPKTNFDATDAATFEWEFTDPYPLDTQSAFEIDINLANGTDYVGTGKLDGTITYRGAGVADSGDNATLTPGLPSGLVQGDGLLLFAAIRNTSATVDTPAGWSAVGDVGNGAVFVRLYHHGDTAPEVTFSGGSAGDTTVAQIAAFQGTEIDPATLTHAMASQVNGSAQDIATPALAVTLDNCVVLYYGWKQDDFDSSTQPSGSTEVGEVSSTDGDDTGITWAFVTQTTAANIAADSFTLTGGAAAISRSLVGAGSPYLNPTVESIALPADTLENGESYQWRVRTWDALDQASPWSSYGTFQCAAGGNVTVVDPAADNPAGVDRSNYVIEWEVTGTTQQDYRVVVTRTDTSAELVNTGWVTSTDVLYTVEDMLSDVEYQVAVTVRNASLVESGTGLRLITPNYSTPETPVCAAAAYDTSGYIGVSVSNPSPDAPTGGDLYDMEDGVGDFTPSDCTFTQSTGQVYQGTYSAELTVVGSPSEAYAVPTAASTTPGELYQLSYAVYSATGYSDLTDRIWWFDSGMSPLSATENTSPVASGGWVVRTLEAEAPVDAVYAQFGGVLDDSPSGGMVVYMDNVQLIQVSDRPDPTGNRICRRRADGTGDTVLLADETEVGVDGTYLDYTAAAGIEYEYMARAVAATGYTDSAWSAGVQLHLCGVWLHDPLDPAGTARQYPYGKSSRSTAVDTANREMVYAGRVFPVYEFGESQGTVYTVRGVIPHGATWVADCEAMEWFATARRTLVFRDNRGRSIYCAVTGYRADDADEGTVFSFTATAVDHTVVTI